MTLDFDPTTDFQNVADALQPVTVATPGSSKTTEVAHALRGRVTTREARRSGGRLTAADVVWHLPAAELPEPPRPGDVIREAGGRRWTVLKVQAATLDGRWRCAARDLAVVHRLDDTIEIQQATYAKTAGGADEPAWHTWKTGLRARIQPALAEVQDERLRQVTRSVYLIYLEENLAVDHRHRVKGPDGTLYRVTGFRRAQRIDTVMEIDAVRIEQ
jgi:hypothetical protein